ncbi:SDR family NAD(P)-dependent oxidoreductase [Aeromonas veronii]|uniref:Short-chain dehydrogenase n=1 Tax=Aeromonas veronii TaxID=654 RepID=A0ABY3MN21_AERVE|nr:SDR family NAD(P)-dependent oxidoreductase [Aeromonas veronii]RDU84790.1 short-chain dehydrogenase [Aeromonas veronii]RDU85787.1 short-chain dehydrogenase [Aeromonas veronii]RDU86534.1 short-chain dehydrogenase [Aeromonas veronii]RDU93740.1 short-chain dehydrogenase [Aeromonas veronii]TEY51340.1 short-chain dehydrogenase [Aeromonas veronii]
MSEGIVVIGASGGIGAALVTHWLAAGVGPVIAISRQPAPAEASSPALHWLCCDYSDEQMATAVARIAEFAPRPHRVVLCNGILHQGEIQPEKRLEAINLDAMTRLYQTNALLPLRWISQLLPLFGREPCTLAVLSARVGSIGDNRAGGWYGYRASKAALNMLLKCAAIELARRAPGVKLLAFHPGTTDTPLSRPFHANVPAGNVQSPEQVANHLVNLMNRLQPDGELSFLDWQGNPIEW